MSVNEKMTMLADAVRSKSGLTGKLSIDGMTAAVNNISGDGTDTSDATALAGDVSASEVFYNADGRQTGTLADTAVTISGNTVTAPAGRLRTAVDQTIPAGSVTLSGDVITVEEGYVPAETKTVPAGSVTLSGAVVNVTEGYVFAETKTVPSGAVQIDASQNKVIITEGYVSANELIIPDGGGSGGGSGGGGGGGDYYKCTSACEPEMVTYLTVSGAGTASVNGDYVKTDIINSVGGEVWEQTLGGTYCYQYDGYWALDRDYDTYWQAALYYSPDMAHWSCGRITNEDESQSFPTGEHPAPTSYLREVITNPDVAYTWDGYKAVLTDGVYAFEDTPTTGLTYGNGFTPVANRIYNSDATVIVAALWTGADPALVFYAPLISNVSTAETGQVMVNNGNVTFGPTGALFTGDNYLEISDVSALPFEGLPLTMYAELQFLDLSSQFNHLLTLGNELGFRYYDALEVFWNGSSIQASTQVNTAGIYKACVTYDGVTVSFYVDGVLAGSEMFDLNVGNNGSFRIGGLPRFGNGKGCVANVRVYTRCLSADEVAELSNA